MGIKVRRLLAGLVVIAFVMAVVSLTLVYFFPAPPSTVTLATAFKGASFDYYGRRYKERLARDRVNLELKETVGAVENLKLLQDPQSGVDAATPTIEYWLAIQQSFHIQPLCVLKLISTVTEFSMWLALARNDRRQ